MSLDPATAVAAGGVVSAYGAYRANQANISFGREQMGFQERMSSTAHQREVRDLRKAGLNPILSATHGGASTPPGANIPQQKNVLGEGVSSALVASQIKKTEAETELAKQQKAIHNPRVTEAGFLDKIYDWLGFTGVKGAGKAAVGAASAAGIAKGLGKLKDKGVRAKMGKSNPMSKKETQAWLKKATPAQRREYYRRQEIYKKK